MSNIKTLAQILADMGHQPISTNQQLNSTTQQTSTPRPSSKKQSKKPNISSTQKTPHHTPAFNINSIDNKNLAQILASVPTEQLINHDKQNSRLRWLAFYYLSKRELSQKELRQKLLAKDQEPDKVAELLNEFASKGYQSDERCAYMLIREAIRKGRGKQYIASSLSQHGIDLPYTLDELIAQADIDSLCDGTILDETTDKDDVHWLKLAIEARSKKYGNELPSTPKEKARQLRFLQYRGFELDVCFDALKTTLDELAD